LIFPPNPWLSAKPQVLACLQDLLRTCADAEADPNAPAVLTAYAILADFGFVPPHG
jgi:hypothetical protein